MRFTCGLSTPYAAVEMAAPGPWGEAIRRLREQLRLTQKELAKRADISPTTYGLIERGGHTLTSKLEQIAGALGVDLVDVLVSPTRVSQWEQRRALIVEVVDEVLKREEQRRSGPDGPDAAPRFSHGKGRHAR